MSTEATPLLQLHDYGLKRSDGAAVIEGLSFVVAPGEVFGVIGESGSGKSQLLLSLLGLSMADAHTTGSARFAGRELVGAAEAEFRALRGSDIAMLFQDPQQALNPYLTMETQLLEVPRVAAMADRSAQRARVVAALDSVGLNQPQLLLRRYPHELSGGMRQRAMLAMALLCEPRLLLADEPTTALDVTTQLTVLDLLREQCQLRRMAVLLVTHDLGVVARVADRAMVMQAGRAVEVAEVAQLLERPQALYTQTLLTAARDLELS